MKKNPYAAIKSQYSSFSKVSKKIADFILDDPTHVTEISVQQAARELDIAESSIVRFCKLVGCSGFTEMKLLLAKYASKAVHTIFEDLSENDTVESITKNVFARNIDTLERALSLLDFDKIDRAASILSQASCILIAGVGASGTHCRGFLHPAHAHRHARRIADRFPFDADPRGAMRCVHGHDWYFAHRQDP